MTHLLSCTVPPELGVAGGEERGIGSRTLGGERFDRFIAGLGEVVALAGLLDELGHRLSVVSDKACEDVR